MISVTLESELIHVINNFRSSPKYQDNAELNEWLTKVKQFIGFTLNDPSIPMVRLRVEKLLDSLRTKTLRVEELILNRENIQMKQLWQLLWSRRRKLWWVAAATLASAVDGIV